MKIFPYLISVLLTVFVVGTMSAQQSTSIQGWSEMIERLEKEIERNEKLLDKISGDKDAAQQQVRLIRTRIESRQEIIKSYDQQIKLLEKDIAAKNKTIGELTSENDRLKEEYAEMVVAAYKNHKLNNSMAFLFASKDFSDMTRRMDYMRRYNRMREDKAAAIDSVSGVQNKELVLLNARKKQVDNSRAASARELASLRKDETTFKNKSAALAKEETKIAGTIKKQESEKKQAQAQLKKMLEEEARKNAAKQRSEAELKAMAQLSAEFAKNRGKLPWPLPGGAVADRFGEHTHPTQKNLKIENNGINIAGEKGAPVRCVFNGEVVQVAFIKGMNNCVIVSHGDYYTVYANLADVFVSRGEKVVTAQNIGAIASTGSANDQFLHFEIFRDKKYFDPQKWLFN